ncbi:hypothetical protein CF327_g2021 [Tilletia walkeri]|nr:hypothetical protein CF327_g2021 [Tilletia walkeri]
MSANPSSVVRAADIAESVTIDLNQATAAAAAAASAGPGPIPQSAPESRSISPPPNVPAISLDDTEIDNLSDRTATTVHNNTSLVGNQLANGQPTALVELEPLDGGAEHSLTTAQLGTRGDGSHVDVIKDSKGRFFRRIIHSASSSSSRKRSRAKQHAGPSGGGVTYGLGHARGAPVIVRIGQDGAYSPHQHQAPQYTSPTSEPVSRSNSRKDPGGYSGGSALGPQSTAGSTSLRHGTSTAPGSHSGHHHHHHHHHAQQQGAPVGLARANPLSGMVGSANPNRPAHNIGPQSYTSSMNARGPMGERRSLDSAAHTEAARIAASLGFGQFSNSIVPPASASAAGGAAAPTIPVNAELLSALRDIVRDEVQTAQIDTVLAFKQGLLDDRSAEGMPPKRASDGTIVSPEHHNYPSQNRTNKNVPDSVIAERGMEEKDLFAHGDESPPRANEKSRSSSSLSMSSRQSSGTGSTDGEGLDFPNPWARFRYNMREPFAEFLGTCILIIFGNGINNQVFVSQLYDPTAAKGDYLSVSFGWGIGTAFAIYVAGGISGAHLNPAVTLSLAIFRGFPWKKVPRYAVAQILGGMMGALLIYGLYSNPIRVVDPGQTEKTAALFTTFPAEFLRQPSTRWTAFYNEVLATAVLLIIIFAIGDAANTPPPDGTAPLTIMWAIVGIGATLGWQTAYCLNIARDLGPRIALAILGYPADLLWSFNAYYFLWTPILATLVGAVLGGFIYDTLIYTGGESPLNRSWRWSDVRWARHSKKKMPAAISA